RRGVARRQQRKHECDGRARQRGEKRDRNRVNQRRQQRFLVPEQAEVRRQHLADEVGDKVKVADEREWVGVHVDQRAGDRRRGERRQGHAPAESHRRELGVGHRERPVHESLAPSSTRDRMTSDKRSARNTSSSDTTTATVVLWYSSWFIDSDSS